jgi:TPR repeat protein
VLIIDALDEISEDASSLGFLPPRLPGGVSALITSRANTPAVRWALEHLHITRHVTLEHLQREDMPAVSGVSDDTPDGKAFNDSLHGESDGLPLIAHRLMEGVDTTQPGLSRQRLAGAAAAVFRRQAQAWTNRGPVAKEALIALGLFEPVGNLSLELLQCYLAKVLDRVPDLADLRDVLDPIANQVQGFEEGSLKLSSRPFAVYVHEQHFSKSDLVRPLTALRSVLSEERSVSVSTQAGFLEFWGHASRHDRHRSIAAQLVDDLVAAQDAKRLLGIAHYFKVWESTTSAYALPCLQQAAKLEDPTALRVLGVMTLDGKCLPTDPVEGRRLLDLASQKGDDQSLLVLGQRLLDGRGLTAAPDEGLQLLEMALGKNVEQASMALGMRLFFGHSVPKDARRGLELLERVATAGDANCMFFIGHFLLQGHLIEKDAAKGREWLTRAAEAGHTEAMEELAGRLLDGADVEPDGNSGRAWYEKAIKQGSTSAMTSLAERLFEGEGLTKDVAAACDLLKRAAESGNAESMGILGRRLLEGEGFPLDSAAGLEWLERGALNGNATATFLLTEAHVKRFSDDTTKAASEKWIRSAIDRQSPNIPLSIGHLLYSAGATSLAELAFRKAIAQDIDSAGNNLFYMLRRGEAQALAEDEDPHALVDTLIVQKHAFAIVNKALALASGFACGTDWHAADALVLDCPVDDVAEVVNWWHNLARKDDSEGHLVLGWLTLHRKASDPDGWPAQRRFAEATRLGWHVPDWLVDAAQT